MKRKYRLATGGLAGAAILAAAALLWGRSAVRGSEEAESDRLEQMRASIEARYTEEYQDKVEQRLETAKQSGDYTEDSMLIEPDPYGTNTLSLYVYFQTEDPVSVSYTVSVEDGDIPDFHVSPLSEKEAGREHEFQVIGLVPDRKNTVTFTLETETGEKKEYKYSHKAGNLIGEEEEQLEKTVEAEAADRQSAGDGLYVILGNDSDGLDFMYYYDESGTIRGEIPLIGYRSHRLLFREGLMYYSISETKIAAVDQRGKAEEIYDLGAYELHHDYVFDEDGDLLVLATDTAGDSVEDVVVSVDTDTGEVARVLDFGELLADYKASCVSGADGDLDWMHLNSLQWIGEGSVIFSSRETSTIIKVDDLYGQAHIAYLIGERSFWEGTGYEDLLLEKDETGGSFSDTGGQHSVTYVEDPSLPEGQYYLYLFNNNLGVSESRPDYDWSVIPGIVTEQDEEASSYYYKYKVDETAGTYELVQSFPVPYSGYVSSVQYYGQNIIVDSGMQGIFGEYDEEGNLLVQFRMEMAKYFIYRVYKYDFAEHYGDVELVG